MATDPVAANPYRNLYIYYLSGRFRPDRVFEPDHFIGSWEEGDFSFLFFTRPQMELVEAAISALPGLKLLDHYHMTYDQWQGGDIMPCRIGHFTISPPWFAVDEKTTVDTILLDPGVVFGTGTHPTTRDCLDALEMAFEDQTVRTTLDLGTGTGLLALAAARLGCPKVLAVDVTLLAAKTAKRNVRLNELSDRILVAQGDAEKFMDFTSDLVVSNIHYDVMKNLIRAKGFLKKKCFILSGLMRSEAARIESTLAGLPVKIIYRWDQDGIWHTFYGTTI
ncbi:MAG: 50S ribosomal protein L11 methyltransferase [Desulfosarcina sp.]|nr:50S ribosomal protein L11 methyltransferase [Desulfosarcina sp.]MBC2744541.1 50S ribosomal protein L11 methyltransferase [Desulfosarcina sp.]MBC2767451.1 methyltransferase [Desulfosarcina sp.]